MSATAKMISLCRLLSLIPSSVESAIAEDPSPFVGISVSASHQVKLRVNILWSLSGATVSSVKVGHTLAEVISRAAKNLRELGAATGFIFNHLSLRSGYLNDYSAAYPPRTEARLQLRR